MSSAVIDKVVLASRGRIMKRIAEVVGVSAIEVPSNLEKPDFEAISQGDPDLDNDLRSLWATLDKMQETKFSATSQLPKSFVENPTVNFKGMREIAKEYELKSGMAGQWLKAIDEAESMVADMDKNVSIDKVFEDALVNMLVPVERHFRDTLAEAKVMAETSKARIAALEADLKVVQADIDGLDDVNIRTMAEQHPEWEKEAAERLENHDWNLIPGEVDKQAH